MTTGLGIAPDESGKGVDPLTHRLLTMGRWESTGIISGSRTVDEDTAFPLNVTGRNDLVWNVSAGSAVCSRGRSDGFVEAYHPATTVGPVSKGDAQYTRYDTIWIKANDPAHGDPDNQVHVGVTEGIPASSPKFPDIPEGAEPIAYFNVPPNVSKTSGMTLISRGMWAIPAGSGGNNLLTVTMNYEGPGDIHDDFRDYYEMNGEFTVPTDRMVELRFSATVCCTKPDNANEPTLDATKFACWYAGILVDDDEKVGGQWQVGRAWEQKTLNVICPIEAGTHKICVRSHRVDWGSPENVYFVCHSDKKETYPPRTLDVWDRGPVGNAWE